MDEVLDIMLITNVQRGTIAMPLADLPGHGVKPDERCLDLGEREGGRSAWLGSFVRCLLGPVLLNLLYHRLQKLLWRDRAHGHRRSENRDPSSRPG